MQSVWWVSVRVPSGHLTRRYTHCGVYPFFSPSHLHLPLFFPPSLPSSLIYNSLFQVATCDYHTAVVTSTGHLYTCGAKENGKLGHGSQGPSGNLGRITRVTKFLDSDEQTDMDVKIGYVSHSISASHLQLFKYPSC